MLHSRQGPIKSMHKVDQSDRKSHPYHTHPRYTILSAILVIRHPWSIPLMAPGWHQNCCPMGNRIHNHHFSSRCIREASLVVQLSTASRLHVAEECGYGFR